MGMKQSTEVDWSEPIMTMASEPLSNGVRQSRVGKGNLLVELDGTHGTHRLFQFQLMRINEVM